MSGTGARRSSAGLALGGSDVLAARSFRPLAFFERHRLAFAELVEGCLAAGLVEEVLDAVARRDEPEPFVVHEPFDRTVGRSRHVVSCQSAWISSAGVMIPVRAAIARI